MDFARLATSALQGIPTMLRRGTEVVPHDGVGQVPALTGDAMTLARAVEDEAAGIHAHDATLANLLGPAHEHAAATAALLRDGADELQAAAKLERGRTVGSAGRISGKRRDAWLQHARAADSFLAPVPTGAQHTENAIAAARNAAASDPALRSVLNSISAPGAAEARTTYERLHLPSTIKSVREWTPAFLDRSLHFPYDSWATSRSATDQLESLGQYGAGPAMFEHAARQVGQLTRPLPIDEIAATYVRDAQMTAFGSATIHVDESPLRVSRSVPTYSNEYYQAQAAVEAVTARADVEPIAAHVLAASRAAAGDWSAPVASDAVDAARGMLEQLASRGRIEVNDTRRAAALIGQVPGLGDEIVAPLTAMETSSIASSLATARAAELRDFERSHWGDSIMRPSSPEEYAAEAVRGRQGNEVAPAIQHARLEQWKTLDTRDAHDAASRDAARAALDVLNTSKTAQLARIARDVEAGRAPLPSISAADDAAARYEAILESRRALPTYDEM